MCRQRDSQLLLSLGSWESCRHSRPDWKAAAAAGWGQPEAEARCPDQGDPKDTHEVQGHCLPWGRGHSPALLSVGIQRAQGPRELPCVMALELCQPPVELCQCPGHMPGVGCGADPKPCKWWGGHSKMLAWLVSGPPSVVTCCDTALGAPTPPTPPPVFVQLAQAARGSWALFAKCLERPG